MLAGGLLQRRAGGGQGPYARAWLTRSMRRAMLMLVVLLLPGCLSESGESSDDLSDAVPDRLAPRASLAAAYDGQLIWNVAAGESAAILLTLDDAFWGLQSGETTLLYVAGGTMLAGLRDVESGETVWAAAGHGMGLEIRWETKGRLMELLLLAEGTPNSDQAALLLAETPRYGTDVQVVEPVWTGGAASGGVATRAWFGRLYAWFGGGDIMASDDYLAVPCDLGPCVTPRRTTLVHGSGSLADSGVLAYDMVALELTGAEAWRLETRMADGEHLWAGPGWTAATTGAPAPLGGPTGGFAMQAPAGPVGVSLTREYAGIAHSDPIGNTAPLFLVTWAAFPFDPQSIGWTDWEEEPLLGPGSSPLLRPAWNAPLP